MIISKKTWSVFPPDGVVIDQASGEITFPKNKTGKSKSYTIIYHDDYDNFASTIYTVDGCPNTEIEINIKFVKGQDSYFPDKYVTLITLKLEDSGLEGFIETNLEFNKEQNFDISNIYNGKIVSSVYAYDNRHFAYASTITKSPPTNSPTKIEEGGSYTITVGNKITKNELIDNSITILD